MSTPYGQPSVPVSARQVGSEPFGDAAVQAAAGEAELIGTNQDKSVSGSADAASGQATVRGGIANQPAAAPVFTRQD